MIIFCIYIIEVEINLTHMLTLAIATSLVFSFAYRLKSLIKRRLAGVDIFVNSSALCQRSDFPKLYFKVLKALFT